MTSSAISKPIFVIGTPRSGTTLTATILGNHSQIFMPGETHYFEDIYSRRAGGGDELINPELDDATKRLFTLYQRYFEPDDQKRIEQIYTNEANFKASFSNCNSYPEMLTKFMTDQMRQEGCNRWGNNAPRDLFSVEDILRFYPDAKFLVCVRDIRAFLYSYQDKWKVTGEDHVERLKKLYHPVVTSFLWKSSMRELLRIKKIVSPENLMVVKYEDLVDNPEKIVCEICGTIEEAFEDGMLQIETHNSSTAKKTSGIFSHSVEGWKNQLTPEEIVVAQIIGKRELSTLGYEAYSTSPNWILVIKYFFETPLALWRALSANREHTGPILPYLFRRIKNLVGL